MKHKPFDSSSGLYCFPIPEGKAFFNVIKGWSGRYVDCYIENAGGDNSSSHHLEIFEDFGENAEKSDIDICRVMLKNLFTKPNREVDKDPTRGRFKVNIYGRKCKNYGRR